MDTCTNVPDMRRKEKQRVRGVGVLGTGGADASQGRRCVCEPTSVRMGLFVVQDTSDTGGDRGTADDLHPPAGTEHIFLINL